jgi:hypothetical protein
MKAIKSSNLLHSNGLLPTVKESKTWNQSLVSKKLYPHNWVSSYRTKSQEKEILLRLGVKTFDDWHALNRKTVLRESRKIFYSTLKEIYPRECGPLKKLTRVSRGYWKNTDTQRGALEKLGEKLGVKELDDWYAVDAAAVRNKLYFIMNYYNSSMYKVLKEVYPQHDWNPLKFTHVPQGCWKDKDTQRDALEQVGRKLGVKQLDDWYAVDVANVRKELSFITNNYKSSLYKALKELYPQHDWNPLKFTHVPHGCWKDKDTQRDALDTLGKKLGVKQLDDWYAVDVNTVTSELNFIVNYYNGSLYKALKELYPQHDWNPLKFSNVPKGYWQNPNTAKHFHSLFRKWKKQHNIQRLRDWYQLPPEQVKLFQKVSGRIFGTVPKMLREWFPETNWIAEVQGSVPETELQVFIALINRLLIMT